MSDNTPSYPMSDFLGGKCVCCGCYFVGICILDDEPFKPVRMTRYDSKANRSPIVLHEEPKVCKACGLQEFFYYLRDSVEISVLAKINW